MKKRLTDSELAAEIASLLDSEEDQARHPDMKAKGLLQQARDAGSGGLRMQYLQQAQREIAKLNPARYGRLISQLQREVLALQGRRGDTEVAHVTRGELVVPRPLQNPEVLAALHRAAAPYQIPLEMLSVGHTMNRINPRTGAAEFGVMDWISGLFGGASTGAPQEEASDNMGQAAVEGVAARAAQTGIDTAAERAKYAEGADALGPRPPGEDPERRALKRQTRDALPPEVRTVNEWYRPDLGPKEGSGGRANVSSAAVNQAARRIGLASKGLAGANALLGIADVATSDNPVRTAVANVGAIGGGLLGGAAGGAGGAALGLPGGPLAAVTAPAGAIAGSSLGGMAGYKGGEELYDYLHDLWKQRF